MAEMKNLTINGTQFTLPFAPAGYGLGTVQPIEWSAVDNITSNGWYSAIVNGEIVTGLAAYMAWIRADALDTNYACQTLYATGSTAILVRYKQGGVWSEWEWENPPMELGVEYRTTERYNGAPVYTKLIDLGSMPANGSGKWVEHGTGSQKPIKVCGRIPSYTLPLRTTSNEITISVTSNYVLVFASASNATDWTGSTGQAQIWYTK